MKKEAFIYLKEVKTFRLIYKMTTKMMTLRVNWQTMKTVQKSDEVSLNEEGE